MFNKLIAALLVLTFGVTTAFAEPKTPSVPEKKSDISKQFKGQKGPPVFELATKLTCFQRPVFLSHDRSQGLKLILFEQVQKQPWLVKEMWADIEGHFVGTMFNTRNNITCILFDMNKAKKYEGPQPVVEYMLREEKALLKSCLNKRVRCIEVLY
jgi:hypothetical protein